MRVLLLCVLCVALAAPVMAGRCGDDVDGQTIPCDCGDVLVSSRTLGDADPITTRACPGTGLAIDLPAGRSATLALGGRNLLGSRRGFGIQVLSGGRGATIVGPGGVQGFHIGILAAKDGVARIADVTVAENAADGISVVGDGYAVSGCEALRNGRDGFALRGRGYHAEGNRALENGRDGVAASGRAGTLGGSTANEASGNGHDGFRVRGRDHDLEAPVATANRGRGVVTRVTAGRLAGAVATSNERGDVRRAGARACGEAPCR